MFRASGVSGELRLGYQVVARLGRWSMDGDRVEATATAINGFYMDEGGPFALWLRMGQRCWVWARVTVADGSPAMVLRVDGSPEVRDAP